MLGNEKTKSCFLANPNSSESAPLFGLLPEEVIRMLLEWMDVPSLSVLIQTSKSSCGSLSSLASDDITWSRLANKRFNILSASRSKTIVHGPRPKSFGGADWKAAYRSMSCCNRMPKNRIMSKKNVLFAKVINRATQNQPKGGVSCMPGASLLRHSSDSIGMWVMVAHTDNCNTRLIRHPTVNDEEKRFIELHICLQNIRSGYGSVDIDVANTSIQIIGSAGDINGLWTNNIVQSGSLRPKIIHRSTESTHMKARKKRCAKYLYADSVKRHHALCNDEGLPESVTTLAGSCNDFEQLQSLCSFTTLRPFEHMIVSVHVPCTSDMVFETDFLSRALCLHIPTRWNDGNETMALRPVADSLVSASFIPETEIWEHYMELPGGCLTLADRNHMISV